MKGGIFGEKLSGKTTLLKIFAAQYGAGFGSEKGGGELVMIHIPDERVDFIASAFSSKKAVYPSVTLEEIPSGVDALVDQGNVNALKGCDFLILLVPVFQYGLGGKVGDRTVSDYVAWVEGELCLADYLVAEKRLERIAKEGRRDREYELLQKVTNALENNFLLKKVDFTEAEKKMLSNFSFITEIPMIVVVNVEEGTSGDMETPREVDKLKDAGYEVFPVCASLEEEVLELPPEEREEFSKDLGITSFAGEKIVRSAFSLLDLVVFLTASRNESRAWTVKRGTTVKEAAGKIHSDMERGFIRAEVIPFDEFRELGGDMGKAKSAGKVRLEGKDYVVQEGDIVTIRFNV